MEDYKDEDLEELGDVEETEAGYDVLATFSGTKESLEGIYIHLAHFGSGQDKEAVMYACSATVDLVREKLGCLPEGAKTIMFLVDEVIDTSYDETEDIGTIFKIDLAI